MTTGVAAADRTTAAASTRVDVLPALVLLLEFTEPGSTGRGSRRRTHCHVRHRGLVTAVGVTLHGSVHGHAKVLLTLLGELVVRLLHVLHLALHLKLLAGEVLLGRDHAHVDILLMSGSDLLLLLLEGLDLLGDGKLLHHEGRQL